MGLVLASASPRRKSLLRRLVRSFRVKPAEIGERVLPKESFAEACVRLAEKKALAVADGKSIVVGADTIAYLGKRNFRKTDNERAARRVLSFLRGKTHCVLTGVCVLFPDGRRVKYGERAKVRMRNFSDGELLAYLRSGEWKGRAGCYDISGKGAALVASVRGERETVIGLPLRRLRAVLRGRA
ncbi:MAG: Maf family protein [Candidatus Micrarchaeota archaeon]|nr:Maf family protein [Candidatus Micrarchaeota archaeon]